MSLFNVCNWWTTQCSDLEENYDVASLLCARFGLEEQEKDYLVVGSHTGHLSIFYPSYEVDANGNTPNYKATDLLLEIFTEAPILGVCAGRFSANNRKENTNQLAVLHPNSLVIYNVVHVGGVAEHGAQLSLQQLMEYRFHRTAFSFCKGHFGKVKGREFFCVVHLDGSLTFYEQDGISYECKFPGHRALPTPVVYCERTDSFFRLASAWNLECYTYQDLSHSSINRSHYQPIWSVCLGEGILDMNVVQSKSDYASIMILGERNFMCLTDTGKVEFILKLDYAPKCFHTFVVGYYWEPMARLITIIVSESSKVFIYENASIIWAAQFKHESPVAIQRSNIMGLPGAIVTLGPTGRLRIGYLGSDPYVFQVPPLNMQELSFQQAIEEFKQLEQEIKKATDIQDMEMINKKSYEDVQLKFTLDPKVKDDADTMLLDIPANVALKELPICSGLLKWHTNVDLAELQVVFNLPDGIKCSQEALTYTQIKGDTSEQMELDFYIADLLHFPTARIEAIISYITNRGIPRVIHQFAYLPLSMFFKSKQPQKAAGIKLTFTINCQEGNKKLTDFFPEFLSWESDVQALGLVLLTTADESQEEIITIVAAKNSNRIRIQSDHLETFPLIMERLIMSSIEAPTKTKIPDPKDTINRKIDNIKSTAFIPSQPILHRIDVHHETQENIRKQTLELDELWQKFKDLQRKLQEKSDDEPKETLVMQIEENYDHLITEGDKLMEMRKDELRQRCDLSCALVVAKFIISTLNLDEKIVKIALSILTTPAEDWTELSWEESMAPGIDMLHHYGPLNRSKNSNNQNNMMDANTSHDIFDYTRFRKHFAHFFDRITRLASSELKVETLQEEKIQLPKMSKAEVANVPELPPPTENWHEILNVQPMKNKTGAVKRLKPFHKLNTLEAVEDDEEEENEEDDEDLRKMGYKKEYGCKENDGNEAEWLNDEFKLPSSDELFNDLGIWW